MKIINLSDLKIEDLGGKHSTLVINLPCPDLDSSIAENDKVLFNAMRRGFENHIDDLKEDEPVLFKFIVNTKGEKFDEYEIKAMIDLILSSFNTLFVEKERRQREYRFGLAYLPQFEKIKDTQLHVMKMVNYKTKLDSFNIAIKFENKTKKEFYYFTLVH